MEDAFPIADLCAALDVSRAGFYSWRQRGPSARDQADDTLCAEIGTLFARSRRTYGSPRLHRALRRAGHACGRHRVARLMRRQRLAGRVRGRRRPFTTDSNHEQPIAPNHLGQQQRTVERPNEVWAADITYVPTGEGWLYLAGVLDLGSRRVVGWAMGESLDTSPPMAGLVGREAFGQRRPKAGLLHHSDRGCQYASVDELASHAQSWVHALTPTQTLRKAGLLSNNCWLKNLRKTLWPSTWWRQIRATKPAAVFAANNSLTNTHTFALRCSTSK